MDSIRPSHYHLILLSSATLIAIGVVQLWIRTLKPPQQVVAFRYQGFVFIEFALAAACRYIWTRTSELWRPSRVFLLIMMLLGMARFGMASLAGVEPYIVTNVSSLCLAAIITLTTLLALADIISYCTRVCSRDISKYKRLKAWCCISFTIVLLTSQRYVAENIQVTHINIPLPENATGLEGLTVAQLSDIHVGPNVGQTKLSLIVEMTNHLQADLIVITGDLVDSSYDNLQHTIKPLVELKSKMGVYFVTGM